MKTTTDNQLPPIANIDTANEEIERLAKQLGQTPPKFITKIDLANEKIEQLQAELEKRKTTPVAAPVTPKPTSTVVPPVEKPKVEGRQLWGLERSIAANVSGKGRPVHTTTSDFKPTGLMRAMTAAVAEAEKKSKSNE